MDALMIASSAADAAAAVAVENHHAEMAGTLTTKVESLSTAARAGDGTEAERLRTDLVAWCRNELLPHALAEEGTLYRAAGERVEARLLVEAMLVEHQLLLQLVDDLAVVSAPGLAAELARALQVLFGAHLAKENEQVLPLLVSAPDVSVAELLGGMHQLLGGVAAGSEAGDDPVDGHAHGSVDHPADAPVDRACGCGEVDPAGFPELDARAIPHAIRHATIFGALDGVRAGKGIVLVAPHDPLPMLAQLERREPGMFAVDYLQRGPEAWRLAIVRRAR